MKSLSHPFPPPPECIPCFLGTIIQGDQKTNMKTRSSKREVNQTQLKKILYYTPLFTHFDWGFGYGLEPFKVNKCPVTNCLTTNDRNMFENLAGKSDLSKDLFLYFLLKALLIHLYGACIIQGVSKKLVHFARKTTLFNTNCIVL